MNIGVVILNYKSSDHIIRLLEELNKVTAICLNIIIVDNSNEQCMLLQDVIKNSTTVYIQNDTNLGYYKGNLVGIEFAYTKLNCNICLVLNPDVGSQNWEHVIKALLADMKPDTLMVGPKVVIPGYKDVSSPKATFSLTKEIFYNLLFPFSYAIAKVFQALRANKSGVVFGIEGSVFIVDANKYIAVQNCFENIFLYNEELLFSLIAKKEKWKIFYNSKVFVHHFHPPRQFSHTYDTFFVKSLTVILDLFYTQSKLMRSMLLRSIQYKNLIKNILLKLLRG